MASPVKPVHGVLPYLYLGSIRVYKEDDFFEKNKIDLIVNCTHPMEGRTEKKDLQTPPERSGILTVRFAIKDIGSVPKEDREPYKVILSETVPELVDLIHAHVVRKSKVLVHCEHGFQRSAAVVVAYVRRYCKDLYLPIQPSTEWTAQDYLDRSIEFVMQQRPIFCTHDPAKDSYMSFESVLKAYDKDLYKVGN